MTNSRKTPPESRPRTFAQTLWAQSADFRKIGTGALKALHAGPKCGATAKHSGQPCRQPALATGRCRYHGGATPAGKRWHVPTRPARTANADKIERKLRDLARRRAAQAERIAAMSPEQRERYEAWKRSHRPGPASARERGRQDRDARQLIDGLLQDDEPEGREAPLTGGIFD